MMMLLWKEWRQQRWFLLCGCLCGLMPSLLALCLGLLEPRGGLGGGLVIDTGSSTVLWGGAFFAAILGIATTQADLGRALPDFWQSRGVSPTKLFLVKYAVAALGLFACFSVVVSLDLLTFHRSRGGLALAPVQAIGLSLPLALMLFGVATLLVALTRDAAKAMLLTVWFGLLVCCLPLLLGGPLCLNYIEMVARANFSTRGASELLSHVPDSLPLLTKITFVLTGTSDHWAPRVRLAFMAVTLGFSAYCLWLAMLAVRNRWVWRPGQRTLAWAIGLSVAATFAVGMRQVGRNMVPVTRHHGRPILPPQPSLQDPPRNTQDWTGAPSPMPKKLALGPGVSCYSGQYLYRATDSGLTSRQGDIDDSFLLSVYRLPYEDALYGANPIPSSRLLASRFCRVSRALSRTNEYGTSRVLGCFVRGDRLYIAYHYPMPEANEADAPDSVFPRRRLETVRFLVVDVSDPIVPRRVTEIEVGQEDGWCSGTVAAYGDYVYVGTGLHLPIVSIATRDEPRIIGDAGSRSPYRTGNSFLTVAGSRLVCFDYSHVCILDLTDPIRPRLVFDEHFNARLLAQDHRIAGVVCEGDMLYVSTAAALYCAKLEPRNSLLIPWDEFCRTSPLVPAMNSPELVAQVVGCRPVTPLERLAGWPTGGWRGGRWWDGANPLILHQGRLIEAAGRFGVLVYDVSDPTRPRRIGHAAPRGDATHIGIWDGLLCVQDSYGRLTFLDLPK